MRFLVALALLSLALPLSAADTSTTVPGAGEVGATNVATTHTSYSWDPPCASAGQADAIHASTSVANERVSVHAEQQKSSYNCGSSGTYEGSFAYVERSTGDSPTTPVYAGYYDSDASNGNWCGSYVGLVGLNLAPGCLPGSARAPYVLDLLP